MKILFTAAQFPPSLGGVENYAFNIALGLQQISGTEVVVVTSNVHSKKRSVEDYYGIKVYRLPAMMRFSNTPINPLWYFSLKRIIRAEKPDIINSHQPAIFMGDMAALVAGKIPFVLTYHAGTMKKRKLPIDIVIYLYEKLILPHTAKKASRIICVSSFVRDTLLKMYASKTTIISPGVNTSLYKPDPEVKREEDLVLFIARYKKMYSMKGLYYLIEAIKMLHGVRLHIVGESEESNNKDIEYVGVKQGKDLVEEMQKASLVVLPSLAHIESFGMVLIEAMACQTPVVGTNAGGIPEVIKDGIDGFLVAPQDSNALALAISKIVSDKELAARMGQLGAAKVREQFTWDTRVDLTKGVFAACLKISPLKPEIVQVTSYYPPHMGGMENVVEQIAEGFVDKEYTVSVYTSDVGYSQKAVVGSKAQVHYLKSIEFAHTPVIFSLFFRLLALPRHSLIHLHVAQAFVPEMVYAISKLRRIPYIAHIHLDIDPSGPLGFLLGPYKKFFLKKVLQSATKLICVSEAQKKSIAAKYVLPLESIVVVPNGVAEAYFIGKKTCENAVPRLLFVGRLAVQKNLPLLIEAMSHMQESVILDIVGEGELRRDVEALIQKYGLQNVQLHGKKTGKELLEFYKSADISVLPSFKEAGASLSMLEALAAGLPIVAADSPEIREMLVDCGVLVQDATPITFAKALDVLISDKDTLCNLRVLAVQKARVYSWENLLNSIESVYKEIL